MPVMKSRPTHGRIDLRHPLTHHNLNRGRVGWWRAGIGKSGGQLWWDLVSSKLAALQNSTVQVFNPFAPPGGRGSAKLVKADVEYFSINSSASFQVQSQTFACWLYLNTLLSTDIPAFWETSTDTATNGSAWGINFTNTSSPTFQIYYFDTAAQAFADTTNLTTGVWTHLAGTWSPGSATVRFYINGSLSSSVATTAGPIAYTSTPSLIGNAINGVTIDGYMDDIQIYNRVLTAEEIFQVYSLSRQGWPGVLNYKSPIVFFPPLSPSPSPSSQISLGSPSSRSPSSFSVSQPSYAPNLNPPPFSDDLNYWLQPIPGLNIFKDAFGRATAANDQDNVVLWKDLSGNYMDVMVYQFPGSSSSSASSSSSGNPFPPVPSPPSNVIPPVLRLNVVNGMPAIRFNGVNSWYLFTNGFMMPLRTMYAVVVPRGNGNYSLLSGIVGAFEWSIYGNQQELVQCFINAIATGVTTLPSGTASQINCSWDGQNWILRSQRNADSSGTFGATCYGVTTHLGINGEDAFPGGAALPDGSGTIYNGDLAIILEYSALHTLAQKQAVESWIFNNFGV